MEEAQETQRPAGRSHSPVRRVLAAAMVRLTYAWAPRWASRFRKWWVILRNPQAEISFGKGCYLGPGFSLHAPGGGTFRVGPLVEFRRGFRAELAGPEAAIEIGRGSVFTYDSLVQCGSRITIGERAVFGQASIIVDDQHRFRDLDLPVLAQGYDRHTVTIADDVFTTSKATIMADIGTRTFVGANAVVSRPLPPYCVAVGVPARPIDYFGPPGQEPPELTGPSGAEAPT